MNREFEFKQLIRAYRNGIISEATFEAEMAGLENGHAHNGNGSSAGFKAFGRTYKSERAAIVSFIDKVRAGESNAGVVLAKWAAMCRLECIRSGIRMIAEREAYHGRVFEQRLRELGGEKRAGMEQTEEGRKYASYVTDPNVSDLDKLHNFVKRVGDPQEAIKPICDFAALIKEDIETKEMLRLFAEDELSTAKWVLDSCTVLTKAAAESRASA